MLAIKPKMMLVWMVGSVCKNIQIDNGSDVWVGYMAFIFYGPQLNISGFLCLSGFLYVHTLESTDERDKLFDFSRYG
jgi:hypothetical protein